MYTVSIIHMYNWYIGESHGIFSYRDEQKSVIIQNQTRTAWSHTLLASSCCLKTSSKWFPKMPPHNPYQKPRLATAIAARQSQLASLPTIMLQNDQPSQHAPRQKKPGPRPTVFSGSPADRLREECPTLERWCENSHICVGHLAPIGWADHLKNNLYKYMMNQIGHNAIQFQCVGGNMTNIGNCHID